MSPNQRRPLPFSLQRQPATMQGLHSRWRGICFLVGKWATSAIHFFPAVELVVAGSITGSWVDAMQMRPRCTLALNHLHIPNPGVHFFPSSFFGLGIVLFLLAVSQGSARLETGFSSLMMMPAQTWRQPLPDRLPQPNKHVLHPERHGRKTCNTRSRGDEMKARVSSILCRPCIVRVRYENPAHPAPE